MKTKETSKYPEETFGLSSETSTREQALAWWNSLNQGEQLDMYEKHLPKKKLESGEIVMDGLAFGGGENQIEEIWRKETQDNKQAEVYIEHQERFETDVSYIQKAIVWWNLLTFESKFYKVISWLKSQGRDTTERHPHTLSTDEIVEIWEREVNKECRTSKKREYIQRIGRSLRFIECKQTVENCECHISDEEKHKGFIQLVKKVLNNSNPDAIKMLQSVDDNFDELLKQPQLKPNQKQFKQFDKELFKKYIDKFSYDDKAKALEILIQAINKDKVC